MLGQKTYFVSAPSGNIFNIVESGLATQTEGQPTQTEMPYVMDRVLLLEKGGRIGEMPESNFSGERRRR